ncbi:MAG: ribonuclease P protein component [Ktedonobacterales bacterium]|nr:ribonuclease P protein component [Ktedonobacterales bacterium]
MPGLGRTRRVRAPRDFAAVRGAGCAVHATALMLGWQAAAVAASPTRFGFVVGKRVGNAVTRNLVKRRLRAIMANWQTRIVPGQTIIITARPAAATRSFDDLSGDVRYLLRRAQLWQAPAPTPTDAADPQEGSS